MEITKEQYQELRNLASQIDAVLNEIRGMEPGDEKNRAYWNKRMSVLAEVMLKGGIVTEEEWAIIGTDKGYDRRGLGGFFVGPRKSMTKIGDNKRAITEAGTEETRSWLNGRWDIKPTEEQLKMYKSLLK